MGKKYCRACGNPVKGHEGPHGLYRCRLTPGQGAEGDVHNTGVGRGAPSPAPSPRHTLSHSYKYDSIPADEPDVAIRMLAARMQDMQTVLNGLVCPPNPTPGQKVGNNDGVSMVTGANPTRGQKVGNNDPVSGANPTRGQMVGNNAGNMVIPDSGGPLSMSVGPVGQQWCPPGGVSVPGSGAASMVPGAVSMIPGAAANGPS